MGVLSRRLQFIMQGWPKEADDDLKSYWNCHLELSVHAGCVLWGTRVVIPLQGRTMVLAELHGHHPGITPMKALAHQLVRWPNLDRVIKELVKNCEECQQSRATSSPALLHPWQWPTQPWRRIHIDFAGPVEEQMLLVVIDAHSKWIEVFR